MAQNGPRKHRMAQEASRKLNGTERSQEAQDDMKFGFMFVTCTEISGSKGRILILNTINGNHADCAFFIEKRALKCDFHDFRFWQPPRQAPEPETATKYASYSRFTSHSCRKALRFRATARFRKMRISQVPVGV